MLKRELYLGYVPAEDGGVTLDVRLSDGGRPGEPLADLPLDHQGAIEAAALILRTAGVREAFYSCEVLTVLSER